MFQDSWTTCHWHAAAQERASEPVTGVWALSALNAPVKAGDLTHHVLCSFSDNHAAVHIQGANCNI